MHALCDALAHETPPVSRRPGLQADALTATRFATDRTPDADPAAWGPHSSGRSSRSRQTAAAADAADTAKGSERWLPHAEATAALGAYWPRYRYCYDVRMALRFGPARGPPLAVPLRINVDHEHTLPGAGLARTAVNGSFATITAQAWTPRRLATIGSQTAGCQHGVRRCRSWRPAVLAPSAASPTLRIALSHCERARHTHGDRADAASAHSHGGAACAAFPRSASCRIAWRWRCVRRGSVEDSGVTAAPLRLRPRTHPGTALCTPPGWLAPVARIGQRRLQSSQPRSRRGGVVWSTRPVASLLEPPLSSLRAVAHLRRYPRCELCV